MSNCPIQCGAQRCTHALNERTTRSTSVRTNWRGKPVEPKPRGKGK